MPELPEAENIGRALKRVLIGQRIVGVEVFSPAMRSSLLPLRDGGLPGTKIVDVRRRGRYLVVELDDGRGLLMHFGMSGVVRVEGAEVPRRKHEHVFIHLDGGKIFRFECTRRFSLLELCEHCGNGAFPEQLNRLGVEPLSEEFSGEFLFQALRRRKLCVKCALMTNEIVVGIGNIYANETLYAAGVDPRRPSNSVSRAECLGLVREAKRILNMAIECGGTTVSDFLNVDGSEGRFARELKVYGKKNAECPRCGGVIQMVRLGGRSSFYCGGCQK